MVLRPFRFFKNTFQPKTLLRLISALLISADPPKNVGGQAVIEGVMMRGPTKWSVAVRLSDGTVKSKVYSHTAWTRRRTFLNLPMIRGPVVLFESLFLGLKALNFSADMAAATENLNQEKNQKDSSTLGLPAVILTFGSAMALAIGLFVILPHFLSLSAGNIWNFDEQSLSFHILDGFLKFAFFLTYVWGIGLIPDIKRVYAYHGAEHKAIYAFEAGRKLIPSQAINFPAWHPRCGTAFIFLLLALSIIFFAIFFPFFTNFTLLSVPARIFAGTGLKILLTIPLAGLSYEITRLAGKPSPSALWTALIWPGLMLQRLTTRPPDESQLEVALTALAQVIPDAPKADTPPLPCSTI